MTTNPQKGDINKPMPESWQHIVNNLPRFDWNFTQAALSPSPETGKPIFSKSYIASRAFETITNDVRFCEAVKTKREEIQNELMKKHGWNAKKWVIEGDKLFKECKENGDRSTAKGVWSDFGKHLGVFEADNTQKQAQNVTDIMALVGIVDTRELAVESQEVAQKRVFDSETGLLVTEGDQNEVQEPNV